MELSDVFRIVNLVIGAITIIGGIAQIFGFALNTIVVGAYMIVFGLAIALLGGISPSPAIAQRADEPEFQIPPQVSRYASFLFSFVGRGAFYIFIGGLLLGDMTIQKIAGGIVGGLGIGYVVLEFIPSIEPPSNMRDADAAGWGAEQV